MAARSAAAPAARREDGGFGGVGQGGAGGAGVVNAAMIASLSNSGMIAGGNGGSATGAGGRGGAGGAGIANSGTITTLTNSGTIEGGAGGAGAIAGAAGDAISSAGKHASIGPITNSGKIIGNVEIDNQASVTVSGGTGKTFGRWTGGTITIGDRQLDFRRRQYRARRRYLRRWRRGNRDQQGSAAARDAGDARNDRPAISPRPRPACLAWTLPATSSGDYGALKVSKLTTLDGGLAIDLTDGFTLATDDRFDILGFGSLMGDFDTLTLDGAACSSTVVGCVDLRRRRASEGSDRPHVA